ncbi:MAG: F0F1 ATP synthase subunit delta [Alphaproteobacteria bacterium]|nr:F0F1 ATP synthase subunit delta [Alphaproteobacteria bacterium]
MATELSLDQGLAGRYATAVFELAQEERAVERVEQDFVALRTMIQESEDLRRLVRAPVFSRDEQTKGMTAILERMDAASLTKRFILTLVRRRRLFVITDVISAFEALLARQRGEVRAKVRSARPLSEDEVGQLKAALRAKLGREARLETQVDPGLLGGLVVQVGSRMIDSSLRSKLNALRVAMRG